MDINKLTADFFENLHNNQRMIADSLERENLPPGVSQEDLDF